MFVFIRTNEGIRPAILVNARNDSGMLDLIIITDNLEFERRFGVDPKDVRSDPDGFEKLARDIESHPEDFK